MVGAAAVFIANVLPAQVVITEVMINPDATNDVGKEWIEIENVGSTTISLMDWCLFVATRKSMGSNRPGNYWWPFPKSGPGSYIQGGRRIVIRWLSPKKGNKSHPDYDEVFTGNTVFDFRFGLFHYDPTKNPPDTDMQLPDTGGAIGLVRTRDANKVLLPGFWADFVEYGSAGFLRESIPAKAGIWTAGTYVPIPLNGKVWPMNCTLAFSGWGNSPLNYWRDKTPTLGLPNAAGAMVSYYGQGCQCKDGLGRLTLRFPIPATLGSDQFRFHVVNGIPGDFGIGFISTGKNTNFSLLGCPVYINFYSMIHTNGKYANSKGEILEEIKILPFKDFVGLPMYAQYVQFSRNSFNGTYCSTNGSQFSIGN